MLVSHFHWDREWYRTFEQDEKHNLLDRLETTNVNVERPGQWFPQRINFTRRLDDVEVIRETLEIENARFDLPEDDRVFTINALNVPPGRGIYERTAERHITDQIWDGNAIRKMNAQELDQLAKSPKNTRVERPLVAGRSPLLIMLGICRHPTNM
jgi:hypothetical protein